MATVSAPAVVSSTTPQFMATTNGAQAVSAVPTGIQSAPMLPQVPMAGGVQMPIPQSNGAIAVVNHIPVVQAFAADNSWAPQGIGQSQALKRRRPGDADGTGMMSPPTGQTAKRKESHNATEQKRRQRINDKMNELKDLLPGCRESPVDKATILNEAIDHIRQLEQRLEAALNQKRDYERGNQELAEEAEGIAPTRKAQVLQDANLTTQ